MGEERRKLPSQETIDNSIAIGKLITTQERTSKDVDKLVRHIEKILPIHEKISNIKKILYSSIATFILFCAWISIEHFKIASLLVTHIAVQEKMNIKEAEEYKRINESYIKSINNNKNQITYLKGRIK